MRHAADALKRPACKGGMRHEEDVHGTLHLQYCNAPACTLRTAPRDALAAAVIELNRPHPACTQQ